MLRHMSTQIRHRFGGRLALGGVAVLGLALAACSQKGAVTETQDTVADRDLTALAGPTNTSALRPVERVPRATFGIVSEAPLEFADLTALVYPSMNTDERNSLMEGMTFFTTAHVPAEGAGLVANQTRCLNCHTNSEDAVPGHPTTNSPVSRAARATPTNFAVTSFNPATGGGVAADNVNAVTGAGHTAAFTIFGDFIPSTGAFMGLEGFSGFVQHTRPSLSACLPDPILPVAVDPLLRGGIDPTTGLSALGARRAVGERAGPPYIGRGLMEAIYGPDITAQDDPFDNQDHASSLRGGSSPRFAECPGDCISGRHNENTSNQAFVGGDPVVRLGRFGLRAAGPTILQFVVGGAQGELGFTSELNMFEINNNGNVGRPGCVDTTPEPELPVSALISCRQLIRLMAPPEFGDPLLNVLRASNPAAPFPAGSREAMVQRGAQLFGIDLVAFANRMIPGRMPAGGDGRDAHAINQADRLINCAACHTPVHTTGTSPARVGGTHLSNVWAPIFADLLLHDGPQIPKERIASTPRNPVMVARNGFRTFDISRNLSDDALPNQGLASGREFRTAPLMGMGRMGAPFLHDARVYLSTRSVNATPGSTVYSDSTVTNAPLVIRTLDDAIRAAIELHDLPAPDDAKTPANGGCPMPAGGVVGDVRYDSENDICPPYDSQASKENRGEAREVIRRFRSLTPADQQALIEFLKQL